MAEDEIPTIRSLFFDYRDPYNVAFWFYLVVSLGLLTGLLLGYDIPPRWVSGFGLVIGVPLVIALIHQWYKGRKKLQEMLDEERPESSADDETDG